MPDEAGFWRVAHKALRRFGDLTRIENVLAEGVPDVNYALTSGLRIIEGWIELKDLDGWPGRPGTVVPLVHYTDEQRQWQRRRIEAGGRVHVLARVQGAGTVYDEDLSLRSDARPDEFFLFPAGAALVHLGRTWPRAEWVRAAAWHGVRHFDAEACIAALDRG